MSSFTSPLVGTFRDDGLHFILKQSFEYYTYIEDENYILHDNIEYKDDAILIRIPEGYTTDFASVPKLIWSLAPPIGKHSKAAVVHDYLYDFKIGNRKWADLVFYEAMKVSGVGFIKRNVYYYAVRMFGRRSWKSDKLL